MQSDCFWPTVAGGRGTSDVDPQLPVTTVRLPEGCKLREADDSCILSTAHG